MSNGVVGLTKVAAIELANTGVTANAICPGWVLTPLVQRQLEARAKAEGISAEQAAQAFLAEKQPMTRFSTPEQIGGAADVVQHQRLVDGRRRFAVGGEIGDGAVVIVAAGDGFFEDRGVGGDAADVVVADLAGEFTIFQHLAPNEVQPDALSQRLQGKQGIVRAGHALSPSCRRSRSS